MQYGKVILLSSALFAALTIAGCSSTKKNSDNAKNPAEASAPSEVDAKPVNPDAHAGEGESAYKTVYFDFDKFNIRADQEENASQIVNAVKDKPDTMLQVQGNTDDRGSVEYNMALGERRAQALKKYLVAHGIHAKNVETVSYGKEHPVADAQNEEAWAKNRRDDVAPVNK